MSTAHKTTKFSIENKIKPSPEQLLTSYTIDLVYKYNEYMSQYTKTIVPQNLAVDGNNIRSTVSFCGGQAKYRFLRWRPWWPSGISDQNDFSYI